MYLLMNILQSDRANGVTKYEISKRRFNSVNPLSVVVSPLRASSDVRKASAELGVNPSVLTQLLSQVIANPSNNRWDLLRMPVAPIFRVRGRLAEVSTSREVPEPRSRNDLVSQFETDLDQMYWSGHDYCCCLDVDGCPQPNLTPLRQFYPQPRFIWASRSRGFHALFFASDGLTAIEKAHLYYCFVRQLYSESTAEYLQWTGAVPTTSDVFMMPELPTSYRQLLSTSNDEENNQLLSERGWHVGMRLAHTECPINPSVRALRNSPPVCVFNDHVYCYICQRPWYFNQTPVCNDRSFMRLVNSAFHLVHWTQASCVSRAETEDAYRCLCKIIHGADDPRIELIFDRTREYQRVLRQAGFWATTSNEPIELAKSSSILAELPACNSLQPDMTIKPDMAKIEWFTSPVSLADYGYPTVTPLRGFQFSQFLDLPEHIVYSQTNDTRIPYDCQPRYVSSRDRMTEDQIQATLSSILPGVNYPLLKTLVAGRACAEYSTGLVPMIFLTGVTGSAKTGHAELASGIAGDPIESVQSGDNDDRFFNSLFRAKQRSLMILLDEFFKRASRTKIKETQAIERLLDLTPAQTIYMIYQGGIPYGNHPFYILCDSELPNEVRQHAQVARRLFTYRLPRRVGWNFNEIGIQSLRSIRTLGGDIVLACDSLISQIVDDYFRDCLPNFSNIARHIGCATLLEDDCGEREIVYNNIRDFYALWQKVEDKRYAVQVGAATPIANAFRALQEPAEYDTENCRKLIENDLMTVLGTEAPVRCVMRRHGNHISIMFNEVRSGSE